MAMSEDTHARLSASLARWARRQTTVRPRNNARRRLSKLEGLRRYGSTPRLEGMITEARAQVAALDELL